MSMPHSLIVLVHIRLITVTTMAMAIVSSSHSRVAWKHHNVVYLDYLELQSYNLENKRILDTFPHKVKNPIHAASHNRAHKSLHEMSHETLRK